VCHPGTWNNNKLAKKSRKEKIVSLTHPTNQCILHPSPNQLLVWLRDITSAERQRRILCISSGGDLEFGDIFASASS